MPLIGEYAKRFGIYDNLPPYLSFALGAGETTLLRMVGAYAMFDNGGRKIAADPDRPHPGPLRPHHLQARRARMPRLRRRQMGEPGRADADRQARARARPDDRLPDHLDDGRRGPARHRHGGEGGRQADRRQDRHHQRREGRLVHRLLARSRGRRLSRLRQAAPSRPRRDRRHARGADRHGFHEGGARRQAGGAVPRAGRHQADPRRPEDRHAGRAGRPARDPGSLQARHRAARQLLGDRRVTDAEGRPLGVTPEADRAVARPGGLY